MNAEVKGGRSESLNFVIQGYTFETETKINKRGIAWWAYVDEQGQSSGREIDPLSEELPTSMSINNEKFQFGPVILKKSDGVTKEKPFHKTRRAEGSVIFDGENISFTCRVTRKRNKKWHLSFTAHQENVKTPRIQSHFGSTVNLKPKDDPDDDVEIIELN